MWDLPRPGLEPVSPALAGRFSTTAPPGKPLFYFLKIFLNLFFKKNLFCYFILFWLCWVLPVAHGLFSGCGEQGPHLTALRGPLTAGAPPAAEYGLQARRPQQLWHTGSVVVFSCSAACGIPPDQGPNPCSPHQQVDSQPLSHQGSPTVIF